MVKWRGAPQVGVNLHTSVNSLRERDSRINRQDKIDSQCYHSIEGELVDVHGEEGVVHVDVAVVVDNGPGLVGAAEVVHAAVTEVSADRVGKT